MSFGNKQLTAIESLWTVWCI